MRIPTTIFCFLILCCSVTATASDTIPQSKPFTLSITLGVNLNSVFGSMHDNDQNVNNQAGLGEVKMAKNAGFCLNFRMRKSISRLLYWKTGGSILYRQVNPQENTLSVYKDELRTLHISAPLLLGLDLNPDFDRLNFLLELGPTANFGVYDDSKSGVDKKGFKAHALAISISPSLCLNYLLPGGQTLTFQYTYMHDLTSSYTRHLWWGSSEPYKPFHYKYKTHCISVGFQWKRSS